MPDLHVEGLCVERGGLRVLRDVGFFASGGEILAVLGPNGAGKSTLLDAIVGTLDASGSVRVDDDDLRKLSARERALRIAYVPQRSELRAALRVEEVVAHGRYAHGTGGTSKADHEAVAQAIAETELDALRTRAFVALSVGEQQRVLVARALCTEAPVMLLDEPTAALDVRQTLTTFALLRRLADAGRAMVVVLHSLDHARRFSDRALLLREGHVVRQGPASEVVAPSPVREVYGVDLVEGGALGFDLPEAP